MSRTTASLEAEERLVLEELRDVLKRLAQVRGERLTRKLMRKGYV